MCESPRLQHSSGPNPELASPSHLCPSAASAAARAPVRPIVWYNTVRKGLFLNTKFAIGWAKLLAFKENLPSFLKQRHVEEYHSILQLVQEGSGYDLSPFRISESEVDHEIAGGSRGTRRRPGTTLYTSDKRCNHGHMSRQIDGVIGFFNSLQAPPSPSKIGFRPSVTP